MGTKYYLAGPMTGLPEYNFPAFDEAVSILRDGWGFKVHSAHEVDFGETPETRGTTKQYHEYIKGCLKVMLECDAVVFLPGWSKSKGCRTEQTVALLTGMDQYEFLTPRFLEKPALREIRWPKS